MKNAILLPLGLTLYVLVGLGCSSNKKIVNNNMVDQSVLGALKNPERVNGDQLIEDLFAQRFNYNKALIKDGFDAKKQFPKSISIINKAKGIISFNGFDYLIRQNKVIGVVGIKLSPSALTTITEQVFKLDQMQQYCCAQANLEYKQGNRNLNEIKALDRQYFAALRALRLVTYNIASLANKPNPSLSIEIAVAQVKLPDIKVTGIKTENKGSYVAEIE